MAGNTDLFPSPIWGRTKRFLLERRSGTITLKVNGGRVVSANFDESWSMRDIENFSEGVVDDPRRAPAA